MLGYRLRAITVMALLLVSGIIGIGSTAAITNAQPSSTAPIGGPGANWSYINGNLNDTNDSPQTLLNANNVNDLSMAWTIPMPNTDPAWAAATQGETSSQPIPSWQVEPGSDSPPLIVDGVVYIVTNQGVVYAFDSTTGANIWSKAVTLNYAEALKTTPIVEAQTSSGKVGVCTTSLCLDNETFYCTGLPCDSPVMHKHGINYINVPGYPDGIISVTGFACELWGFDASTGDVAYHITNICDGVQGNGNGAYPATYTSDPPEYYNGQLLYVMGGYTGMGGRTFLTSFNASEVISVCAAETQAKCAADGPGDGFNGSMVAPAPQGQMWQIFLQPPASGGAGWDEADCSIGHVFDYPAYVANGTLALPCTSIPSSVTSIDWGTPKVTTASVSTSWGQYAIDNKTGVMYFGTGESGPFVYYNEAVRPGLDLYSSSEMAVNLNTGKLIWWFQMLPHGLSDWDASWNSIIGTTNGTESIFKGTKDGIVFSMNAATGAPNWVFSPPSTIWASGLAPLDPTNVTQMEQGFPKPSAAAAKQFGLKPGEWIQAPSYGGALESDLAYDGQNIYGAWFNSAPNVEAMIPPTQQAAITATLNWNDNTTLYAINANTGHVTWDRFFGNSVFRGGMTVTNGMIIMPFGNGTIYFLSTATGKTLGSIYIGAPIFVDPTIGQNSNGQLMILQIIGGGRWESVGQVGGGLTQPGALMAFTLGSAPSGGSGGSTSISTTAIAVGTNLPLNQIAYAAVAFAIVITIVNVMIAQRSRNKGK